MYVAAYTKRVNLGFYRGALMKNPRGLLQGTGNQSRHIPIDEMADLEKAYVRTFVKTATKMAERPAPGVPPKTSSRVEHREGNLRTQQASRRDEVEAPPRSTPAPPVALQLTRRLPISEPGLQLARMVRRCTLFVFMRT